MYGRADSVTHGAGTSTLKLADGRTITGSMILDATGHVRKLVSTARNMRLRRVNSTGSHRGPCVQNSGAR